VLLEEVSSEYFASVLKEPFHVFASANFNELNESKVEKVFYLLFKDSKYRMGLVVGKTDTIVASPFSAPFGGLTPLFNDIKLQSIEESVDCLITWAKEKGFTKIKITLPPPIYFESYLAKVVNVFYRKSFITSQIELNYHYDLNKFSETYANSIWRNARKNLNQALANDLYFTNCDTDVQKEEAYQVIQHNRTVRGVPFRMSWQQVVQTTEIVLADFFLVAMADGKSIAAAIVFKVAPKVVQVIYWGDLPEFSNLKTMNFLSFKIFEFYKNEGYRFIDIGYSTVDSMPNYGLCEFKESIGCDMQPKLVFEKEV
jgi:hypothetical protein